MENINELIAEFIQNVEVSNIAFDYADKKAKKRHNLAIDKYRSIAKKLSNGTNTVCDEFFSLLHSPNENIAVACAVCVIEIMESSPEQYSSAVKRIEEYVKNTSNKIKALGFEIYLKKLTK